MPSFKSGNIDRQRLSLFFEILNLFGDFVLPNEHVTIKLLCIDMSCFGTFDTASQSVFGHCCGVSILILFQLDARHHLVGAQSRTGRRFRAVAFGCSLLLLLAFPFCRYDGHERRMDMRRCFIQMQVCRYDVLLAERRGKVFHIVGAPFVQPAFAHDALHIVGTAREHDADCPHLVLADLAGKSCGLQTVLDRLRAGMDAVGIFD